MKKTSSNFFYSGIITNTPLRHISINTPKMQFSDFKVRFSLKTIYLQ